MWFHFEKHYEFIKDVPLIGPMLISHVVSRNYPGKRVYVKIKGLEPWIEGMGKFAEVDLGNCVGQFGFNVADALDAENIILIGNDLAFQDGRTHTAHTHSDMLPQNTVKVKGYYGGEVESSGTFKFYIEGFQSMIAGSSAKVINATEGGAYIPGAEHSSLESVLSGIEQSPRLEFYPLDSDRVKKFYRKIIKNIFDVREEIISRSVLIDKTDRDKPEPHFKFIDTDIQVILNHFMNPEFFLEYYDILSLYHPMRYENYIKLLKQLTAMMIYACDFVLNINAVLTHNIPSRPDNVLLLLPEGYDPKWLIEKYRDIKFFAVPAMGQLTKIWEVIARNGIGTVVAFNRQVSPDTWTIPRINCIDIHDGELGKYHPVENYTVAAVTEDQLSSWPPVLHAGVPKDTVDNLFRKLSSSGTD